MSVKIAFTGPESTGKSTISKALAKFFKGNLVEEYAREYLNNLGRDYNLEDLSLIAKKQLHLINNNKSSISFFDTEMLVLKIWSEFKYKECSEQISLGWKNQSITHYFLCDIDCPWEHDELREHPEDRKELFERYKKNLQQENKSFTILSGDIKEREDKAKIIIAKHLEKQ